MIPNEVFVCLCVLFVLLRKGTFSPKVAVHNTWIQSRWSGKWMHNYGGSSMFIATAVMLATELKDLFFAADDFAG